MRRVFNMVTMRCSPSAKTRVQSLPVAPHFPLFPIRMALVVLKSLMHQFKAKKTQTIPGRKRKGNANAIDKSDFSRPRSIEDMHFMRVLFLEERSHYISRMGINLETHSKSYPGRQIASF